MKLRQPVLAALLVASIAQAKENLKENPFDQLKQFSAIIRLTNNATTTITVLARYDWEARNQIINMNCGGEDCIVEGPWRLH